MTQLLQDYAKKFEVVSIEDKEHEIVMFNIFSNHRAGAQQMQEPDNA